MNGTEFIAIIGAIVRISDRQMTIIPPEDSRF